MDSAPPSPPPVPARQTDRFRRILTGYFGDIAPELLDGILAEGEWREYEGGERLFTQGDPGDAAYFLISGRLRAYRELPDGGRETLGDILPGETVGEIAVLADDVRGATVLATRDSVAVRMPTERLHVWFLQYPHLLLQTARLVIRRTRSVLTGRRRPTQIRNLTLVPLSPRFDLTRFRQEFLPGLTRCGRALTLDPPTVDARLDTPGIARVGREDPERYRLLSAWLDEQESTHDYVVYLADADNDAWTQRCLRQADRIVLLADPADDPLPHAFEQTLVRELTGHVFADIQLALWHPSDTLLPSGTARWLTPRPWVREAIHVRRGEPRHMERLARLATGNAVGLVLGSGGARGLSAIGVIRALEEAGVPVDRVGGTSIGAIMAAAVALDHPVDRLTAQVKDSFRQNPTHPNDLSPLPILSIYRGKRLNGLLQSVFPASLDIEDLWLNFFCVTSDMAGNREVVHTRGALWRAIRASASLPGIFPLVRLGDGLHVDGAFLNALPVDVMAAAGARKILAVDFSWLPPTTPDFDEVPGPLDFLKEKLIPARRTRYPVPTLLSGLVQSSLLASSQRSLQARAEADVLFSPDLQRFELLGWHFFDALVRIGYEHAREVLAREGAKLA